MRLLLLLVYSLLLLLMIGQVERFQLFISESIILHGGGRLGSCRVARESGRDKSGRTLRGRRGELERGRPAVSMS